MKMLAEKRHPRYLSARRRIFRALTKKEEKEMRSVLKACDLEDRFPILAVENNCIVSKDADITVAFEVELPELYTVTAAEYEAIHGTWVKAMKVLPKLFGRVQAGLVRQGKLPERRKRDGKFPVPQL